MNEQENDREKGDPRGSRSLPILDVSNSGSRRLRADLVVDLSEVEKLDLASLALLLTAQRQAQQEDRTVWLAGVPAQIWQGLEAMGLGRFFKAFPVSAEVSI